ncbi:hypothetical protein Tco_1042750 [Tanacetum coccineum]|uniref:Reverse transcriptase domain-containing protein n=1 Tax=Tanacetum coccineum TaxID=301880 RepID=A0ABQ5GK20_9ASTR
MVSATKDPLTFDDLMATPINFSKYVLNRLKIDNLTQDILLGPAYNLLKGTCSSSIKLKYRFQECFNALTDRLDWNNPQGYRYPFDLSKPLPLQGHLGHLTVAADYFFNNDLEYLKYSDPKKTRDMVKRADRQFYKFKEGDFVDLHLNDIEDMLLLAVQRKLFHLINNDIVDYTMALRMFTRSLVIKKRVEDLQLGVESYQKKLNITPPQQTFTITKFKELYTPSHKPPGVIYEDLTKQKRVMQADELYKFSDGTLKKVRVELHHRIRDFRLEYNTKMPRRKCVKEIRNLERLVGARELEMDYKLMTLTMEILPEPTSNKLCGSNSKSALEQAGNLVLTNFLTPYDVLVVPEYCVILVSIHEDSMNVKVMGIDKQVRGLYYSDKYQDSQDLDHVNFFDEVLYESLDTPNDNTNINAHPQSEGSNSSNPDTPTINLFVDD